jgi:hypothetical protein
MKAKKTSSSSSSKVKDKISSIEKKKKKLKGSKNEDTVVEKKSKKMKKVVKPKVSSFNDEDETKYKVRKSKKSSKEEATCMLNSFIDYDDVMDVIEKKYDTGSSQLSVDVRAKLSTGLLVQDLVLSGGILGGGWYTFFGQEQSAKSTLAMQCIIAAINTDTPLIGYYDYEGCHTTDTTYSIEGNAVPFMDILPKNFQETLPEQPGFLDVEIPAVDTLGGTVRARVFYGGIKECLKITTETGNTLEGSKHPFMVQLADGNLAWKMIEELSVGDVVLQQR